MKKKRAQISIVRHTEPSARCGQRTLPTRTFDQLCELPWFVQAYARLKDEAAAAAHCGYTLEAQQ